MGYIKHDAILVTGIDSDAIDGPGISDARRKAKQIGLHVTDLGEEVVNGYQSFAVLPDGSKEGWGHSDHHNALRMRFIEWLEDQEYEDGSSPLDWVHVSYGGMVRDTMVVDSSDHRLAEHRGEIEA